MSELAIAHQSHQPVDMLMNQQDFAHGQRVANLFAASQLIPSHLRGKVQDCFIALHVAQRMNEDPLTVMQNMYVVSGKPGWAASYMIARINKSGLIKGRITWDITGKGESLSVTAKATLADTGEEVSATVDMAMAKAESWTKNAKYQSMPEVMLRYRSASFLKNFYFPDVMLGYQTIEEIETQPAAMRDVTPINESDWKMEDGAQEEPAKPTSKLDAIAGTTPAHDEHGEVVEQASEPVEPEAPSPAKTEKRSYEVRDDMGEVVMISPTAEGAKLELERIFKHLPDKHLPNFRTNNAEVLAELGISL